MDITEVKERSMVLDSSDADTSGQQWDSNLTQALD